MQHHNQPPSNAMPKAAGVGAGLSAGGPGLMMLLKELGWTLSFPVILLIGIGSIIALIVSAVLALIWVWRLLKFELEADNSTVKRLIAVGGRHLIPLVLSVMTIAGLLLIGGSVLGWILYLREPQA